MAFIETVADEAAQGETAVLYEEDRQTLGYVANYTKAFSNHPDVMRGWEQLIGTVRANMDRRLYELATLAAAKRLRSSYCSLAHGGVLEAKFYAAPEVASIARNYQTAGLSEADVALMAYAESVAANADEITQEDIDRLRGLGFDDDQIFSVAAAAALRCFFAKLLDAVGAEPDAAYRDLDPELRESLTVGRPIESGSSGPE